MLTRLEVDGFKNLLRFEVDFGPFNCIAGPNGVGKSNIFDAIRFLSLLADHTLIEAAQQVRGTDPETADIRDLFWTDGLNRSDLGKFSLAAEMIVEPHVVDDFGRPAEATSTYLRYQVEIGYEPPEHRGTLGRLLLLSESLKHITKGDATNRLFPHSAQHFRDAVIFNRRKGSGFISTEKAADGQTEILIHQDGGSFGRPQKAPAISAPRTIVATSNTSTTPTILAARREMQSWKLLALEPTAMRGADRFQTDPHITANGDHLPATLYRLATNTNEDGDSGQVYARIAARLADLVPVRGVEVEIDQVRQLLTVEVEEQSGSKLPARSLSDGTLRFLTLSVLSEDPDAHGLICMEEPENGIHPAKMKAMVELLRDIAVDPNDAPSPDNPMRQVILATHSPTLVQLLKEHELLLAEETTIRGPKGNPTKTLRCRPLAGTWRSSKDEAGVGVADILVYLTAVPNAQIKLPFIDNY